MEGKPQVQPAPDPNEILIISVCFFDCSGGNREHRTSFSTYQEALSIIAGGPTELIDRKKAKENGSQNVYPCYYGNRNNPPLFDASEGFSFMEYGHSKTGEFSEIRNIHNLMRIITDQEKELRGVIFHHSPKEKDHRRATMKKLQISYKQLVRKEFHPGRSPTRVELQKVLLYSEDDNMTKLVFDRARLGYGRGGPPVLENLLDGVGQEKSSQTQERELVHEALKGFPENLRW